MVNIRRLLLVLISILSIKVNIFAVGSGGIANEVTSAEHLSNLLAVTGSKTDPSVVYNNPAAIGDTGKMNVSIGASYFNASAERKGNNGASDKMETTNSVVPNFSFAHALSDGRFGIGLAVVSPYGLQTEWPETSGVRYVATKSELKMVDITPGISYRHSEKIAVGVGIDYFSTFDADLQKKASVDTINGGLCLQNVLFCPGTSGAPEANSRLSGDGNEWGYHAGLLYNPSENHTFGFSYHSEIKTRIEGELELTGLSGASASAFVFNGQDYRTPVFTDLFYPQNFQFGYKYSQQEAWEMGVNFAWYDWSSNRELAINLPNATSTQKSIVGAPIPLDWRDVWSATLGGTYHFSPGFRVHGGVYYIPAVYPESTFSPSTPDMNKIGLSIGPSFSKKSWRIDTVYNPLFYKSTNINNTVGQDSAGFAGADISGKYEAIVHILGVNVKYNF